MARLLPNTINMTYAVKEIFYTLQGEGARAGRPAVFLRFAGCNLWSGLERDRQAAQCNFCDTDFVGTDGAHGGKYRSAPELAGEVAALWPGGGAPYVVCTGGEPLLQLDDPLIEALQRADFEVAVETNGTLPAPVAIDWICVSPKQGADFVQVSGQELKLVFPQEGMDPAKFESEAFEHFFLQPMDGPKQAANIKAAISHCLGNPKWRLSLQTHKIMGID